MAKGKTVNHVKKLTAVQMHALKSMIREAVPDEEIIAQLKIDDRTLNKFKDLYKNEIPDHPVNPKADKIKLIKDKTISRLLDIGLTLSVAVDMIRKFMDAEIVNYPDPDMGASYLYDKILPHIDQSLALMNTSSGGTNVAVMTPAAGLSLESRKVPGTEPTSAVKVQQNDVFTFPKKV